MRIHILGCLCLIGFCGFFSCSEVDQDRQQSPNVLFVVFDDLNDWVGALDGHVQSLTPNIDRLAKQGVLFSNAHCAGTMCCPSRAAIISGLRPTTTGIYKNTDTPLNLYKEKQTLNRHFKQNGYYVAGAGKILHKFYYEENDWDEFSGRRREEGVVGHRENPQKENIEKLAESSLSWGPFSWPDSLTYDARSVQWISEKLVANHEKPFFLACGIFRPHIPWFNPQEYFERFPADSVHLPQVIVDDLNDVPLIGKNIAFSTSNFTKPEDQNNTQRNKEHRDFIEDSLWHDGVQAYMASVCYADAQLGKLLEALETSPYVDNTIVVLFSDHGWHLGEKGHWRKATLWEEVTRVPLIISGAGISGGGTCTEPVSLLDIYPTLIDLCRLPAVPDLDGQSLRPQLDNPMQERTMPAISSLGPDYHSIRDRQYRYISYGDGQEELYDHESDPAEWDNLASDASYLQVKERLRKHLPKNAKEPVQGQYAK